MNSYRIFDGNYQSLSVQFKKVCVNSECHYKLEQSLSVVIDPIRTTGSKDWSLYSMFNKNLDRVCQSATSTQVTVNFGSNANKVVYPASVSGKYELTDENMPFSLSTKWMDQSVYNGNPNISKLHTHRYLGGVGDGSGTINIDFTNENLSDAKIEYFESISWVLKLYLHTLTIDGVRADTNSLILQDIYYQSAINRKQPTVIELLLTIPAQSTVRLSIEFDRSFIRVDEHYPDANHGFDIGYTLNLVISGLEW